MTETTSPDSARPHVAILGAGPVGLDAALAASGAGLPFTVYEAGERVADHVRRWGHVRLFSPWSLDLSPRMRRALAQAGADVPPGEGDAGGETCPTGAELCDRALEPLAHLPALAPHLRRGTRVVAVARRGLLKHEEIASEERAARPFRLLVEDREGERVEEADLVLDCTGTWRQPNALGDGGIPAPGERSLEETAAIVRHLPDLEAEREAWAGRHVLLAGGGHSAWTAVRDLARLAESEGGGGTRVTWLLRDEPRWDEGPDPLPERGRLRDRAREIHGGASPAVEVVRGSVEALAGRDGEPVRVTVVEPGGARRELAVDRVLALTGYAGDLDLYRQLQVHTCYATEGPMKLSAALLGADAGGDCLAQESHGVETLLNPEPGFFVLGSKSYGRNSQFLLRVGYQQVDELFAHLAGR